MKILFVNEKCGYLGGVEQNVADAAAGLRARGHQCYLAYGVTTEREVNEYMSFFDCSYLCPELGHDTNQSSHSFDETLQKVAPEVIYLHRLDDLQFCEHLFSKVRTVRMVHDHNLCCPRRHKYFLINGRICDHKADWRCWLDGAFLERGGSSWLGLGWVSIGEKLREMRRNHRVDRLLVGSRFMREELLQNGFPGQKVHILPPVVRMKDCAASAIPSEKRVLYVGQLIRGKGVDLLLHALRRLSCDFTATIVGAGNAQGKLEALCRGLGLGDKVQFRGWVSHEEVSQHYADAKVVVVPSRWPEPFGMIGLEAMHHGRPVVAFRVGGIPDWLEDHVTGLLVPEQDVDGLARSVEQLLMDTELAERLGRKAYERVRDRFSFDEYVTKLESHLRGDPLPAA